MMCHFSLPNILFKSYAFILCTELNASWLDLLLQDGINVIINNCMFMTLSLE